MNDQRVINRKKRGSGKVVRCVINVQRCMTRYDVPPTNSYAVLRGERLLRSYTVGSGCGGGADGG